MGVGWGEARAMHVDARAPHQRCAEDPVDLTVAATRVRS